MEHIVDRTSCQIQYNVNKNVSEGGRFVGLFQGVLGNFQEFQGQFKHAFYESMIYLLSYLFIFKYNHH